MVTVERKHAAARRMAPRRHAKVPVQRMSMSIGGTAKIEKPENSRTIESTASNASRRSVRWYVKLRPARHIRRKGNVLCAGFGVTTIVSKWMRLKQAIGIATSKQSILPV